MIGKEDSNGRTHEPSLRELTAELDGVKALLLDKINSLDRLCTTRFDSSETAVQAALAAQEKTTNASFSASEKAVLKAEDAQKDYNQRSNEFRGQLDDQAKTLMPRNESQAMFKAFEEKIEAVKTTHDKDTELMRKEVAGLRETRSSQEGKSSGFSVAWAVVTTLAVIALAIIGLLIRGFPAGH